MAGLVIPDDRWMGMHEKLSGLKRAASYHGEVKWRFFAPKNDDPENPMAGWVQEKRNDFRERVFAIITETKSCRIIACISESPTAYELGNVNSQDDLYFRTYKPITERFQYLLQDITRTSGRDSFGLIVADHRVVVTMTGCDINMSVLFEKQGNILRTTRTLSRDSSLLLAI